MNNNNNPPALLVVFPPPHLFLEPVGNWGISYDLNTHKIEDNLPGGWGIKNRSSVYRDVVKFLRTAGFQREQYSSYENPHTSAPQTWLYCMEMRGIRPPGIMPTITDKLHMYFVSTPAFMRMADDFQLSGAYSPDLIGPTPVNLIPQGVHRVIMAAPPNPLPIHVRSTPEANTGHHWARP
ncbi:hypothetical protein B0H21DRAFT_732760 [Amylocystis lapponica]|nr:hypothetical protein B0H21DRAFT_732760 [Amylocystis lapponica]